MSTRQPTAAACQRRGTTRNRANSSKFRGYAGRDLLAQPLELLPLTLAQLVPSMGGELKHETDDGQHQPSSGNLLQSLRHYPKGVFYMLGNEFCERFSFYGMRAVLVLYLVSERLMSHSQATLFYHLFISLAYVSPLFGSIVADNYLGRFRVILYVSLVYVLGHVLLSFGAMPILSSLTSIIFDFSGLFLIALATGGIKPCVSAFAADQFGPNQQHERAQFFSFFYFAINAGSLVAIIITPILRGRISCFGSQYCFPLAFGVPGLLMLIAFVVFLAGWSTYKKSPPVKGNVVWQVCRCICFAANKKIRSSFQSTHNSRDKKHWVDFAYPTYSRQMIANVKSVVSILVLFVPVTLFWALYDQQGSTWVLQAKRMNGRVGWLTILPDQMNIFNPLFILIMVPMFEGVIYPMASKVFDLTPLRKIAVGGLLAALSFVLCGLLQLEINKTMEPVPAYGNVSIRLFSSNANCAVSIADYSHINIRGWFPDPVVTASTKTPTVQARCANDTILITTPVDITAAEKGYAVAVFALENENEASVDVQQLSYDIEKTDRGSTRIYVLADNVTMAANEWLCAFSADRKEVWAKSELKTGNYLDITPPFFGSPNYLLKTCANCSADSTCTPYRRKLVAGMGAAHIAVFYKKSEMTVAAQPNMIEQVVRPNTINLLWQLPAYFVMTLGEVLFSVTGLEFSYTQAAPNMKSVLQAMWLMTVFLGNVIDMGISGSHIIPEPASEFFVYAALMVAVMLIFILLATRYNYVDADTLVSPEGLSPTHGCSGDGTPNGLERLRVNSITLNEPDGPSLVELLYTPKEENAIESKALKSPYS